MSGRNSQVARIFRVLTLLESAPNGLTVVELTERLNERGHNVNKRTVYRDLEALEAAGFPVSPQNNPQADKSAAQWRLERNTRISQHLVLSPTELLALYFAREALVPLKGSPLYEDIMGVFQKIEEKLGSKCRQHLDELSNELHVHPMPKWGLGVERELLETVRACCSEGHVLQVTYQSASGGDTRVRRLGPHYLYFAKGSMYLVAEDLECAEVKVFALPRMSAAQMLEEAYRGDVSDPAKLFEHSLGVFRGEKAELVRIQFAKQAAPYVLERSWHPSQTLATGAQDSLILSLRVAVTPELVQWLLSFGAKARVLEPTSLQERVVEAARQILGRYPKKTA